MSTYVYDTECYVNYFLLAVKEVETGTVHSVDLREGWAPMAALLNRPGAQYVGFNSIHYDAVMLAAAAAGWSAARLKTLSDELIQHKLAAWDAYRKYKLSPLKYDHIDLKEVAPSFVSLKTYAARLHQPRLVDLPYHPNRVLTEEEKAEVARYCVNDLDATEALLHALEPVLLLRCQISAEYQVDVRSKSDTQIAETVLCKRLGLSRSAGRKPAPAHVTYEPVPYLRYRDPALRALVRAIREHTFTVDARTGHVRLPAFLDKVVEVGAGRYKFGVGGLHSQHDKQRMWEADDAHALYEIDAASYYPSIILRCGLAPPGMDRFKAEYEKIYHERLAAKAAGDKAVADTLKVSLNGSFGKFSSRWSPLYAPDLGLAITLTGQLTLLMLIEGLENCGIPVVSANTDGIVVRPRRTDTGWVSELLEDFSARTGYVFERTDYRRLAFKDVNSYFGVTDDSKVKRRGIYAPLTLRKNPTAEVVAQAAAAYLAEGTPITDTVENAPLVDFISARNVTGGGQQGDVYLGKTVRWYMTTDKQVPPIRYAQNNNLVPKTTGARACMDISTWDREPPTDIDRLWYVAEAVRTLYLCGAARLLPPPAVPWAHRYLNLKLPKSFKAQENQHAR